MAKKSQKPETTDNAQAPGEQQRSSVKDSAQLIWQAGLGAFAKAQAEGTRAFEALVKEGNLLQRKTQTAAEEKLSAATSKMTDMASDISSKASGHWDKLETIFEDRVAKALGKLGVPSAKDMGALLDRIAALDKTVANLSKRPVAAVKPLANKKTGVAATATLRPAVKSASKPKSTLKSVAKPGAKIAPKPVAKRSAPRNSA